METDKEIRILIFPRGWTIVGEVETTSTGMLVIKNGAVIRRWGTTEGLGEIARDGPTDKTILDSFEECEADPLHVIFRFVFNPEKWECLLKGR